ncbi:DUF4367 domain-containing protein [Halalkalibacter alkalisediminis]|uniref:DUF4367 domain-containing protein n=1 Tax=Halalkalibacter alkalisediminis TaxID=935616 RepID=A0ABV6NC85_9BACI|nr:DUF4367 domain-containing protein [Halalkalibacter alkalisediminis]
MIRIPKLSRKNWIIFIFSLLVIGYLIFLSPLNKSDRTWYKDLEEALVAVPFETKALYDVPESVIFDRAVILGEGKRDSIIRFFYSKNDEFYFVIDASLMEMGFFYYFSVEPIMINQNQGYIGRSVENEDIKIIWVDDGVSYSIENIGSDISEEEMLQIAASIK